MSMALWTVEYHNTLGKNNLTAHINSVELGLGKVLNNVENNVEYSGTVVPTILSL